MLIPEIEPYIGPISYPLSATLMAKATKDLRDSGALDTNLPYGAGSAIFKAGFIMKLTQESGEPVLDLSDATYPIGIVAGSFVDALKSGNAAIYYLQDGGIFRVNECYDIGKSYAVNTLLTVIGTGANQGKLTPATEYVNQRIVAIVIKPPTSPASDDIMTIKTCWQAEAV